MYTEIAFFVTPDNTIHVQMLTEYPRRWLNSSLFLLLDLLQIPGQPKEVYSGTWPEVRHYTLSWILPISLAEYLVDYFKDDPRAVLCHLNSYLNSKGRPSWVIVLPKS